MTATIGPGIAVHLLAGAFLLPPLCLMLPLVAGYLLRKRRSGRVLMGVSFAVWYVLSTPLVAEWLDSLLAPPPLTAAQRARVDAIVVLGGGKRFAPETGREELAPDPLLRLVHGARLARASGKPLLLSGGAPLGGTPEAEIMQRTLREDFGMQARWVEAASLTTADNAARSAALLKAAGVTRIALVSQGWHLARAVPAFARTGLVVCAAPTGFVRYDGPVWVRLVPGAGALASSSQILRELAGQVLYRLRDGQVASVSCSA